MSNAFIAIDRKLSIPEVRDAICALSLPEGEITTIKLRVYGGGLWEVVSDSEGEAPVPFNDRHKETFWLWQGDCPEEATHAAAWMIRS
jgi:hypothetical protein